MAFLLDPLASKLVDTSIDLVKEGLHSFLGVPEEIEKLRVTLRSIQAVLNDAKQKQITQEPVKIWLRDLKDVMYDADDILDEYRIAAEEWASREHPPEELSAGCRMWPRFSCFRQVKSTHEIGSKIRDLNLRLEQISAIRDRFKLEVDTSGPQRQKLIDRVRRETSPGVEPDIVGEAIENNTRNLVDLLKKEEKNANSNVVVLAIVGVGGIGKTTLAQKIFDDHEIKAVFQKTMWVCVSQEFVETDLLRKMITSARENPGEARSKAELETKVKDMLKERKFLLVLDDIWNEQIWGDLFRKPLQVGAVGSRVLVTTRNQRVAERMKAIHIHNVNQLPLDDSWLLLCKKVTKNVEEERDVQSLKDIGLKIVKKCQGLPLAITVIGGVLCGKFERCEWEKVERNSAWSRIGLPDGVHQALFLSYEDLPSYLRQCFLYCSLFPEDSDLDRESLAQLWVAEGFVIEVGGEEYRSLEEIAQGYFDELVQRSLLQTVRAVRWYPVHVFGNGLGGFHVYIMHDLLRSLCHFLARGESSVITKTSERLPRTTDDDYIKLRRLSVAAPDCKDIKSFLCSIQSHKSVRTLLLKQVRMLDDKDIEDCFNNFHRLRVVDLRGTSIRSLPHSVRNLLHLRYLNLDYCAEMTTLPDNIASLKNLQFLILYGCTSLQTLPKGVVELHNLRTLHLHAFSLKELPSGILRLEHLNVLRGAVVSSISSDSSSSSSSCSLEEITQLYKLRELSLDKLSKLGACLEFDPNVNGLNSSLRNFKNLASLILNCYPYSIESEQGESLQGEWVQGAFSYSKEVSERIEKIFDVALHPPLCVRQISIVNFFGYQFPWWLMSSSIGSLLPNLTSLKLVDCFRCSLLPQLGKLLNLEELELRGLDAVTSIGAEFFGYEEASSSVGHESGGSKSVSSSSVLFPRLKKLYLVGLDNLKVWQWVPEDGRTVTMPQLNKLIVCACPKLLSLPKGLNGKASRLTKLKVVRNNLNSISGIPSIKKLIIIEETSVKIVSHLPAMEVLEVDLTKEQSLSLPDWLVQGLPDFTSLQRLYLTCQNELLIHRCLQDGPDWPKISHIPVVHIRDYQNNYITHNKYFSTFQTNINLMTT